MAYDLNNNMKVNVLQRSWHGLTAKTVVCFPSVASVRSILRNVWQSMRKEGKENYVSFDGDFVGMDVRLQVRENGRWQINCGLSDYDQDHRGFWGASSIPFARSNLTDIAKDLIEQAKEHCVSSGFLIYREKR